MCLCEGVPLILHTLDVVGVGRAGGDPFGDEVRQDALLVQGLRMLTGSVEIDVGQLHSAKVSAHDRVVLGLGTSW